MTRLFLVRAAALLPVRDFLWRLADQSEAVLRRASFPRRLFDDPETLVPYPLAARLLDEAASVARMKALGAHIGLGTRMEDLGVFGRYIATRPTLLDALRETGRLAPRYFSGELFWLKLAGPDVTLRHRSPAHLDPASQQAEQLSLCCMLRFLTSIEAPPWRPTIHLKKMMPPEMADMPFLRESAIVFEQGTWAITFPRTLLHRRLPASMLPPPTATALEDWKAGGPASDFAGAITQVIASALATGNAAMDLVALWIDTSVRTLQRRLKDVGVSYAQLLADARFDAARRLLDDRRIPVASIASRLGYSDPAHFSRAFRRWAGSSPRTFRQIAGCETASEGPSSARERGGTRTAPSAAIEAERGDSPAGDYLDRIPPGTIASSASRRTG